MKENYIQKEMLRDTLDNCFWEVMDVRTYFLNEILFTDFINYTIDSIRDNNDLQSLLAESKEPYVHPYIARKISLYYKAEKELMRDIKFFLLKEYNINYDKELKKKSTKRNERR